MKDMDDSFDDMIDNKTEFVSVLAEGDDMSSVMAKDGDELPLIPLRNMVMFPGIVMPVSVGRKKTLRLIKEAYDNDMEVCVATQRDARIENPKEEDLYSIAVIAHIVKILEMPDGSTTVLLQGRTRADIVNLVGVLPYMKVSIKLREETCPDKEDKIFQALGEAIKEVGIKVVKNSDSFVSNEAVFTIRNIEKTHSLINFACANFGLKVAEKVELLSTDRVEERGNLLLNMLNREAQLLDIKANIQSKTRTEIDQQQREFFLQQQMKAIQDELGIADEDQEIDALRAKAETKKWDAKTKEVFEKELHRLERINPHSPDYSVQLNYVETILNLPWNEFSIDNFDLKRAQRVLNRDHYGLDEVKERILEHLAVLKLQKNFKSPILCLYGPPGVGKTSLGKSIAETLNRKYVRVSLGGMQDEAEIRGHRRTYIGAMPGRIIQNIQKAGTSNPVFVLDEIDKVNNDYKGDPASALLEVLDPEQNSAFHDNYLDIDYDLSNVLFIATANNISSISRPLLDRMELIEVSGYVQEEKLEIAAKYLVPKQLEFHGLKKGDLSFSKLAIKELIDSYTRESGVRELDRTIAKVVRKIAKKAALGEEYPKKIEKADVCELLGMPRYSREKYEGNDYYGVVTGLAWTSVGGEILFIEASMNTGKEHKMTLTGNLGDVMKESAILALEYIKSHVTELGVDEKLLEEHNFHIHVPEGAIPKDGPSAGITMVTALISVITRRKVKKNYAMTGEITLRGKVMPVGGIREKILAAKRAGITDIVLCIENKKDIEEIKPSYLKGMTFHYVSDIKEVLEASLEK